MPKPILVDMLGEFTLQEEGASSVMRADLTGKSRRLWILIAYLIINRDRGVSTDELIEVLWPNDSGDNRMATLQNNVSRARALFQKEGFEDARDFFKFEKGEYFWAPHRETILDCDLFEAEAKRFEDGIKPEELNRALGICSLYNGDFLSQANGEAWCANSRIYYKTLFIRLCSSTAQALLDDGRLEDAQKLCERAIRIDPSEEIFSVLLMRAFLLEDNPRKALDHYASIKHLYETEYSVSVSDELEFERSAALQALYGRDTSEASIRSFLRDSKNMRGAFQCDNSVFGEIVRLHMRDMQRSGDDAQLAAIGFSQNDVSLTKRTANMKRLEETLLSSLRLGDPFTKMNSSQFLALLPGASKENGDMIMRRVVDRFNRDNPQINIEFQVFLFDLSSFDEEILDQ